MKRVFCLFFVLVLLPVVAFADLPDLSIFTMDELHELQAKIRHEIISRSQWAEVTVPVGYYVIGEDIPAGHWTLRYAPGEVSLVEIFHNADVTGLRPADALGDYVYFGVGDPENPLSSVYENQQIDITLVDGYHFNVNYGPVIFEPFTGRPSPFF